MQQLYIEGRDDIDVNACKRCIHNLFMAQRHLRRVKVLFSKDTNEQWKIILITYSTVLNKMC